jgi:SHS2 domain-containing protein
MDASTRYLDHPSDIGIEASGATRAEAFANAAAAMISLLVDQSGVVATGRRTVSLNATDEEQLLVRWLSELLYLYDGQQFVSTEFTFSACTATTIEAVVAGERFDPEKHSARGDIKAVTYHQISVRHDERGCSVRVFLDI